jgi:hypothetical protein
MQRDGEAALRAACGMLLFALAAASPALAQTTTEYSRPTPATNDAMTHGAPPAPLPARHP